MRADPRIEAYIERAAPFAQPILRRLRAAVHAACPDGDETSELKALVKRAAAGRTFAALSPGHQREYTEWIIGAKREATRVRRLAQAIEWLAEGKTRNWKYENC